MERNEILFMPNIMPNCKDVTVVCHFRRWKVNKWNSLSRELKAVCMFSGNKFCSILEKCFQAHVSDGSNISP